MQMIGPTMLGMTAGSMVGHLAQRSFGQYDLPIPRPAGRRAASSSPPTSTSSATSGACPPTTCACGSACTRSPPTPCSASPTCAARLDELLRRLPRRLPDRPRRPRAPAWASSTCRTRRDLTGLQSLFGDPETLLGAIQSPAQRDLLPRFEALVAVIVGYVDHVMDRHRHRAWSAATAMVTEAVRRRRVEADQSDRFVERLFGLELTQAQYDRGTAFVAGVVERAGDDGLARLWESERTLPTPAEVDAPVCGWPASTCPTD